MQILLNATTLEYYTHRFPWNVHDRKLRHASRNAWKHPNRNHPWPNALSLVETQFYYYRRRFTSYVTHLASARWFESVIRVVQIRINFRIYRIFQGINGIHWLVGEVHRIQRSVSNRYFDGAIFVHRVRGPAIKWERDRAKLQWRLFKLTGTRRALRLDAGPIFTRHRSVSVSILSIDRVRLRFWKHSKICPPPSRDFVQYRYWKLQRIKIARTVIVTSLYSMLIRFSLLITCNSYTLVFSRCTAINKRVASRKPAFYRLFSVTEIQAFPTFSRRPAVSVYTRVRRTVTRSSILSSWDFYFGNVWYCVKNVQSKHPAERRSSTFDTNRCSPRFLKPLACTRIF